MTDYRTFFAREHTPRASGLSRAQSHSARKLAPHGARERARRLLQIFTGRLNAASGLETLAQWTDRATRAGISVFPAAPPVGIVAGSKAAALAALYGAGAAKVADADREAARKAKERERAARRRAAAKAAREQANAA